MISYRYTLHNVTKMLVNTSQRASHSSLHPCNLKQNFTHNGRNLLNVYVTKSKCVKLIIFYLFIQQPFHLFLVINFKPNFKRDVKNTRVHAYTHAH